MSVCFTFQEMENKIRMTLNEIYFGKTQDIVNGLRSFNSLEDELSQKAVISNLKDVLNKRGEKQ